MHTYLSKINLGKYNKKHLGILFIVGVLLVVIAMPTSQESEEIAVDTKEESVAVIATQSTDYKTQMEEQLALLLSQVDGVGEVQVMITLESTEEKIVEKDVSEDADSRESVTVFQETDEGEEPYITQELYPIIEGVVVIATGGDNSIVIKDITEAVQALFDVDTHKIKIMKMKSD